LAAQRQQLLIEQIDASECLAGKLLLPLELFRQGADTRLGSTCAFGIESRNAGQTRIFRACRRECGLYRRELIFQRAALALFERKEARQLRDLQVQLSECRILAARFLADEILGQHEQREQEDEG